MEKQNKMDFAFLTKKVLEGGQIQREEALALLETDLEELCEAADRIRQHFCGNAFDLCTIINGKSGKCSEDCKYCAQAGCYQTDVDTYALLPSDKIAEGAKYNAQRGVARYSIVTSGRRISKQELDQVCDSIRDIKETVDISVCGSFGLLEEEDFCKLKKAGVTRIHNNLETSRRYFGEVCTTHTYEDKIAAIQAAKRAGLEVCSGGIMGIGETMEDRIDMFLDIRALGVKSIPINLLNPIPGTPYEKKERLSADELRRIIAVARFIVPDAMVRMAGGRGLLPDKGEACFRGGANAAISGDMLTTSGITIEKDMELLERLGYQAAR
ncbi:MAG: biotin synthase BioB [Clostridiaceae bacterium]|nr:biotin synthase BioB [Clostridiaceae bacterium]